MRVLAVFLAVVFLALSPAADAAPVVAKHIYGALTEVPTTVLYNASTSVLTTTTVSPFTDLPTTPEDLRDPAWIQDVTIVNFDASDMVCWSLTTCTAASCSSTAPTFSCLASGTHGVPVPAMTSVQFKIAGNQKLWIKGSSSSVDVLVTRSTLFGKGGV